MRVAIIYMHSPCWHAYACVRYRPFEAARHPLRVCVRARRYVARSFLVTLAALAGYMWLSRAAGWGLAGVWWGIVLFFGVRAAQSTGRVLLRHMRGAGGAGGAGAGSDADAPGAAGESASMKLKTS